MTPATIAEPVDLDVLALWDEAAPAGTRTENPAPQARGRRAGADEASGREQATGTLEHVLAEGWVALEAGFVTACLMCGGRVRPRWSAGAGVVGGRCDDCGTQIE